MLFGWLTNAIYSKGILEFLPCNLYLYYGLFLEIYLHIYYTTYLIDCMAYFSRYIYILFATSTYTMAYFWRYIYTYIL